jgi:uncharacterized protein (TIGR03663 family)
MSRALFLALAGAALALSAWLRFAALDRAPLHADESTGAKIVGTYLATGGLRFDPKHFHGPLLHRIGGAASRLAGSTGWGDLEIGPLRAVAASAGCLLVLCALAFAPLVGRGPALAAGAFLGFSPPLVHFSRIYIHETLLAVCAAAALLAAARWWRRPGVLPALLCGLALGLAAATRETFVLAPAGWMAAALALRLRPAAPARAWVRHGILCAAVAAAVAAIFYGEFGARPSGIADFAATYLGYEVTPGHEKPPGYYAALMLGPHFHGRLRWWTGGTLVLAAFSFLLPGRGGVAGRFLFLAGLAQGAVYSCIAYKVPWLMVVPWAHIAASAGCCAAGWAAEGPALRRAVAGVVLAALLAWDLAQSRLAAFRFPSDDRNPFAYVPTAPGVGRWTGRFVGWVLERGEPGAVAGVIGARYWPLPWYLRGLPKVGYWAALPEGGEAMPLVVAMPDAAEAVSLALAETHCAVPEGLRTDTPVLVFVRNDIWEARVGGGGR